METGASYDYLLSMPIWSLTLERVEALKDEADSQAMEVERLRNTTSKQLWAEDLDAFLLVNSRFLLMSSVIPGLLSKGGRWALRTGTLFCCFPRLLMQKTRRTQRSLPTRLSSVAEQGAARMDARERRQVIVTKNPMANGLLNHAR